jgi:hypothetical protein
LSNSPQQIKVTVCVSSSVGWFSFYFLFYF